MYELVSKTDTNRDSECIKIGVRLVEATGFEPATSWSRTKRATKLRYASNNCIKITTSTIVAQP